MSEPLEFYSFVGHQPWFFVPDTGKPGGSAVVEGPSGAITACTETQVTQAGDRVGFLVPAPFDTEGDYTMTVTQDDVVTVYLIHVAAAEV